MTAKICACEGLDPKCPKCFGSGYVDAGASKKSAAAQKEVASAPDKKVKKRSLSDEMASMSKEEVEKKAVEIIGNLDLKSKKQMQLLNSIPFNTNTFRRDFPGKFESLEVLEREKRNLRNELEIVDQEIFSKQYSIKLKFNHFLSDKDIDVTSNRQLKDLIRGYKKTKQ